MRGAAALFDALYLAVLGVVFALCAFGVVAIPGAVPPWLAWPVAALLTIGACLAFVLAGSALTRGVRGPPRRRPQTPATMSLCSRHYPPRPDCDLCNADPRDLFSDWDVKLAEAEAAGEHTCARCGFVYYRTVGSCPKCNAPRLTASSPL